MSVGAPFGTDDQPQLELKIVGGKQVEIAIDRLGNSLQETNGTKKHFNQSNSRLDSHGTKVTETLPPWATTRGVTPPRKILRPLDSNDSGSSNSSDRKSTGSSEVSLPVKGSSHVLPPISKCKERTNGESDTYLMDCINQALTGFDSSKLKDVYLTFAGFDSTLSGFVIAEQVHATFLKYQIPVEKYHLQLLIDKFMSSHRPNWVNYEELLKFVSRSVKPSVTRELLVPKLDFSNIPGDQTMKYFKKKSPQNQEISLKPTEVSPRMDSDGQNCGRQSAIAAKKAFQNRQDANLLLQMEQLFSTIDNVDKQISILRMAFEDADHSRVEYMNEHKLKSICLRHRLPFNSSLLDKIIGRLDHRNTGKVSWVKFLDFLRRAVPLSRTNNSKVMQTPPSRPVWETKEPLQSLTRRSQVIAEVAAADQEEEFDRQQKILDDKLDKHYQERVELLQRQQQHLQQQTKALQRDHLFDVATKSRGHEIEGRLEIEPSPPQDEERKRLERRHKELLEKERELGEQKRLIQHEHEELEKYVRAQKEKSSDEDGVGGELMLPLNKESKIERFTRLTNALFVCDQENSGFIDADSAIRLIKNYNLVFDLDLTAEVIAGAVNASTTPEGFVNIKHVIDELHQHI